ncbi:MAG: outer membrane lipoprotein-sorting protein [Alphaproteobacteria bacterium]|nr:outer membrane lipoprotein-sorting protein [Alphaproteobacteria bacterium]
MRRLLPALLLSLACLGPALSAPARAEDPSIDDLLDAADDIQRGASSHAVVVMQVKTDRYERTMKMESWAKGTERSLIRILEPAKDAGVATLMVDDNIWNYLPKVDRTMKVPAGMMGGSWMGSHFTNDDLVKESRMSEDFTGEIVGRPEDGGVWKITLTPKPDAPVVWGKVEIEITPDKVPTVARYYDEKGNLVRTMTWGDVREMDGRKVPAEMKLVPAEEPDEFTLVRYDQIDFDIDVSDDMFSLQALKR